MRRLSSSSPTPPTACWPGPHRRTIHASPFRAPRRHPGSAEGAVRPLGGGRVHPVRDMYVWWSGASLAPKGWGPARARAGPGPHPLGPNEAPDHHTYMSLTGCTLPPPQGGQDRPLGAGPGAGEGPGKDWRGSCAGAGPGQQAVGGSGGGRAEPPHRGLASGRARASACRSCWARRSTSASGKSASRSTSASRVQRLGHGDSGSSR